MRLFFAFFLAITLISAYFWATDAPGSGMAWPTCIFAGIGLGVGGYNWLRFGSPLAESPKREQPK